MAGERLRMQAAKDEAIAQVAEAEVADATETDSGPAAGRRELTRFCIASRTVRPVDQMLRFVVAPDGMVVPDLGSRLPGRGAWVEATRTALAEAIRRKAFGRAFRGKGRVEPALPELVDSLLEKDAFAALGFANKAGRLVTGTTKVAEALRSGEVSVLVHAADAASDGVAKIDALARRVSEESGRDIATVSCVTGVQLDLALGRANVVHAALLAHPTSAGFLARIRKLERWRAG